MTDVLTKSQRRYCMSRIRGKNTKPEMIVRQIAWGLGYRYRLHCRTLPGKPDLIFHKHKCVIFVHGCFWHMHSCKDGCVVPKTNTEFWQTKRLSNKTRDFENQAALKEIGWRVLVIWECQIKDVAFVVHMLSQVPFGSHPKEMHMQTRNDNSLTKKHKISDKDSRMK